MRGCEYNLLCSPKKIKKKYRNMLILKKYYLCCTILTTTILISLLNFDDICNENDVSLKFYAI